MFTLAYGMLTCHCVHMWIENIPPMGERHFVVVDCLIPPYPHPHSKLVPNEGCTINFITKMTVHGSKPHSIV